jgi:hypothetical protein
MKAAKAEYRPALRRNCFKLADPSLTIQAGKVLCHRTSGKTCTFDLFHRHIEEGDSANGSLCPFAESHVRILQDHADFLRTSPTSLLRGSIEVEDPFAAVFAGVVGWR